MSGAGRVVLADGGHLAYDVVGEGPDVVLIHPGLWDRRTWDPQMTPIADAGFRAIRYDVRGYGGSSRLDGRPYSHVRDLVALLDALDVRSCAVVGCSMGGGIAIDLTLERPDRVWALVAVAAALGGVESLDDEVTWWEEREGPIDDALEAGDLERAQELRLEIWASLGTKDPAGERIREIAFDNLHELTMDESAAEGLDPPAAARLHEIDVPTLVIEATDDPPEMRRIAHLIARGIMGARPVTIRADHVVNLRNPEAFDEAVIPFLREASP